MIEGYIGGRKWDEYVLFSGLGIGWHCMDRLVYMNDRRLRHFPTILTRSASQVRLHPTIPLKLATLFAPSVNAATEQSFYFICQSYCELWHEIATEGIPEPWQRAVGCYAGARPRRPRSSTKIQNHLLPLLSLFLCYRRESSCCRSSPCLPHITTL